MNIGQLRDIWLAWAGDASCTCGQGVCGCAFWGAVRQQAFADSTADDLRQIDKEMRQFMADANVLRDWNDALALRALADTHAAFLARLKSVVATVLRLSGASVLVDSSKSPEFALAVHLTGLVDLFVLNLVRDPRAVACSWVRKKPGKINQRIDAWTNRQKRLTGWHDIGSLHHRVLRYEDFVAAPAEHSAAVLQWVNETLPDGVFVTDAQAQVTWEDQHLFPPSNETVLAEKREQVTIAAPTEWRRMKYWPLHLRVLLRSFPQGLAYVLKFGRA